MQDTPSYQYPKTDVLIVNFSSRGGLAHHVYFYCEALVKTETDFTLLTTHNFEMQDQCRRFLCVTTLYSHAEWKSPILKGLLYSLSLMKLLRYLKRTKPKILHLQESKIPQLERLLLAYVKRRGIRIVFTAHDLVNTDQEQISTPKALIRLYSLFDRIIAHSQQNRLLIASRFRASLNKIVVHPVGDYSLMAMGNLKQPAAREELHIPIDHNVLLFCGYIRKYKGLGLLLEALVEARTKIENIVLIVAGEAKEDFRPYRQLIERHRLEANVMLDLRYLPHYDMSRYLIAADIVVLPYLRLFQSGLVRLAHAHKRPVIASKVGDLPMVVIDNVTGFLVEPGSLNSLVTAITNAFSEKQNLAAMGEKANHWMSENFSWNQTADATARIYRDLMQLDEALTRTTLGQSVSLLDNEAQNS